MTAESPLSDRETEVLNQLVNGASNNEIAHTLNISPNTVKVHVRNIYSKLGVLSRTEATTEALRRGLVIMAGVNDLEPEPDPEPELEPEQVVAYDLGSEASEYRSTHVVIPQWAAWLAGGLLLFLVAAVVFLLVSPDQSDLTSQTDIPDQTASALSALENTLEPLPPMREATGGAGGVYVEDAVFVIGGTNAEGPTAAFWKFEPSRGVWVALDAKPTAASGISAGLIGDQIYVPGGLSENGERLDVLDIYDLQSQTWREGSRLPVVRSDYGLATIEGKLYVFGGLDANGPVNTTLIYSPETQQWSEGTPLPIALSQMAVAQKDERQVYIIGGVTENNQASLRSWRFLNGDWQERAELPNERVNARAVFVTDRLYLVGGTDAAEPMLYFYGNTWKSEPLPLNKLSQQVMVSDRRRVYLIGGWNGTNFLSDSYIWDPIVTVYLPSVTR